MRCPSLLAARICTAQTGNRRKIWQGDSYAYHPISADASGIGAIWATSFGQIGIRDHIIRFVVLPVYGQPICPGDGFLWTPATGRMTTASPITTGCQACWFRRRKSVSCGRRKAGGWGDGGYFFNEGYWGPTVGFYGGINYGFGYYGEGYGGGPWNNGHFFYNRSVNNINVVNIHNVYNERELRSTTSTASAITEGQVGSRRVQQRSKLQANQRHIPAVAAQTGACAGRPRQSSAARERRIAAIRLSRRLRD